MAGDSLFAPRWALSVTAVAIGFLLLAIPIERSEALRPEPVVQTQQLDDDKFEVREKAAADLAAIGEPAIAKLAEATAS